MTVNSTSSTNDIFQLLEQAQAAQTSSTSNISSLLSSAASTGVQNTSGDSSSLSAESKLFSELHTLSKTNPTEFKKITSEIGQQLSSAASSSSDAGQASFLSAMASRFDKASQSGNFSDLFPNQSPAADSADASPYSHGGSAMKDSSTDPLSTLFSQALSQIQTDLSASSSS